MPSVPGYTHRPGHHCGSTALRNLLGFHGVEISEEMAFGLGAGACFYYVTLEDASPSRWFNGRTARLEENFNELTGAALRAAHLRGGRRRAPGRRRGPRSTPATRSCCSPTSTTSTTTATRPTSPATRSSSPATTTRSPTSPTPASRSCRRRGSRTSTAPATAAIPPTRSPATCSPPPATVDRRAPARGDPGGDRARGEGDGRARDPRLLRPRRGPPPRRGGRRLAGGRRGLAVVRALRLPGDRAPRHRRRRLPADVLALPRGGRTRGGAARRRGRGTLDRRSPAPSTPPARATTPSRASGARSTAPAAPSPRPRSASGPPLAEA